MIKPEALVSAVPTHPAFQKHRLVGTPGFALPEFAEPIALALTDQNGAILHEHGISLRGVPGQNSHIVFDKTLRYSRINITSYGGADNLILLGSDKLDLEVHLKCQNAAVVFGNTEHPSRFDARLHGKGCGLFVGPHGSSNGGRFHVQGHGSAIMVGEDHMFSWGIMVLNHDGHGIFDYENGALLNQVRDIVIGPHVWLGFDVAIFKGVSIGAGSIIGARSVLTRDVPRCSAFAGNPAILRRSGISWTRFETAPPAQVEAARALIEQGGQRPE